MEILFQNHIVLKLQVVGNKVSKHVCTISVFHV